MEQVHDDRLVPAQVIVPGLQGGSKTRHYVIQNDIILTSFMHDIIMTSSTHLLGHFLVWPAVTVLQLLVRFLFHSATKQNMTLQYLSHEHHVTVM